LVQDAINKLMKDRTVIIIAHRLSTVRDADQIFVFDQGKIVAHGKHEELLSSSPIYANLVRKQLDTKKELSTSDSHLLLSDTMQSTGRASTNETEQQQQHQQVDDLLDDILRTDE
jgi:ABC-type multidrug transport system ATPase subunit